MHFHLTIIRNQLSNSLVVRQRTGFLLHSLLFVDANLSYPGIGPMIPRFGFSGIGITESC